MIEFEISVSAAPVIKMLNGQRARLMPSKRRKFLKRNGARMVTSITKNFNKQGRPSKWAPLQPSTIKGRKKGQRKNPKILQASGDLKRSIVYEVNTTGTAVAIGTHLPYSPHLQKGRTNMKARKHIMFQREDIRKIELDAERTFGVK